MSKIKARRLIGGGLLWIVIVLLCLYYTFGKSLPPKYPQYRISWEIVGTNKVEHGAYFPADPRYNYQEIGRVVDRLNREYPNLKHWAEKKQ